MRENANKQFKPYRALILVVSVSDLRFLTSLLFLFERDKGNAIHASFLNGMFSMTNIIRLQSYTGTLIP